MIESKKKKKLQQKLQSKRVCRNQRAYIDHQQSRIISDELMVLISEKEQRDHAE